MAQTIKLKRSATQGSIPATSALSLGEVAINTYDGKMYIKKNVGGTESIVEIGSGGGSGLASSFTLYEYTATSGQTTFSGSDSNSNTLAYDTATPPKILVYLNGVLLDHTTDYTATNGTSVVLTNGAATSDLLQIAAYKSSVSTTLDIDLSDSQKILFGDDDDLEIYHNGSNGFIKNTTGDLYIEDTNGSIRLRPKTGESGINILADAAVELYYDNAKKFETTNTGIDVTGNIVVSGTVDGRDVATDGAKLDNIESNADVTDATNVTAAGALMDSEVTNLAQVKAFDSSDYATAAQGSTADSALQNLVEDTTPQLGGNLDLNSNNITGTGNINITGAITSSGNITGSNLSVTSTNWIGFGDYGERISGSNASSTLDFYTDATLALRFNSTQDATFEGNIVLNSNGKVVEIADAAIQWYSYPDSAYKQAKFRATDYQFKNGGNTPVMTISSAGNIVASGTISSGNITAGNSSTAAFLRAHYNDGSYMTLEGYGLEMNRGASYIRPSTDNDKTLYIGGADASLDWNAIHFRSGNGLYMTGTRFIDSGRNLTNIGTISSGNITTSGYLAGPATFTIDPAAVGDNTGTVVIAGNLQVDGTTTTINSTTLTVDDLNITLASGSSNSAAANGAGITVDCGSGTDATLTYNGTLDTWNFNKDVRVSGSVGVTNIVTNKVVKFNGTILDDSSITDTGSLITLGTSTDVSGPLQFTSNVSFSSSEAGRIYKASNHGLAFHGVTGTENDFAMFTPAGQLMVVNPTGTNNVALVPSAGGSVGIGTGTSTPARKLEVKAGSEGYVARFKGSTSAVDIFAGNTGSFTGGLITTPTNIPLGLSTNTGSGVLIIATNNNVGIGLTDPDQKLDVNGNIRIPNAGKIVFGSAGASPGDYLELNDVGSSGDLLKLVQDSTTKIAVQGTTGNVSIGVTTPFTVGGTAKLSLSTSTTVYLTAGASSTDLIYSRRLSSGHYQTQTYLNNNTGSLELQPYGGKVGVGTNGTVSATFQVEEAGIDTTTTSTTATTQVAIDTFAAATFRSARYTIQVTNSTDSTYHLTEVLLIHDGTTPQITEYGTIFTGSAEATFDADISSGNVRLLATPATTDSMTFKVVRHCITV